MAVLNSFSSTGLLGLLGLESAAECDKMAMAVAGWALACILCTFVGEQQYGLIVELHAHDDQRDIVLDL